MLGSLADTYRPVLTADMHTHVDRFELTQISVTGLLNSRFQASELSSQSQNDQDTTVALFSAGHRDFVFTEQGCVDSTIHAQIGPGVGAKSRWAIRQETWRSTEAIYLAA